MDSTHINFWIERIPWLPLGVEYILLRHIVAEVQTEDERKVSKVFRKQEKVTFCKVKITNLSTFPISTPEATSQLSFKVSSRFGRNVILHQNSVQSKYQLSGQAESTHFDPWEFTKKQNKNKKPQYLRKLSEAVVLHQPCGINQERTEQEIQEITRDLTQEAGKGRPGSQQQSHRPTEQGLYYS